MDCDALIFEFNSTGGSYEGRVWRNLARHVVGRLAVTTGYKIHIVEDPGESYEDGFSIEIRSEIIGAKPWHFGVRGIVGGQISGGKVLIRAWLFLYLGNLLLSQAGRDVLVLRYSRKTNGMGTWENEGWSYGEPGEWQSFAKFEDN
jgi:hypothetical protein